MSNATKVSHTNIFVRDSNKVLLALRKSGWNADKWNGLGDIADGDEPVSAYAHKHVKSAGLEAEQLNYVGFIQYKSESQPNVINEVYVFVCDKFKGEPTQSDELKLEWYDIDKLPYSQMYQDGMLWHKLLFDNIKFKAEFVSKDERPEIIFDYFIEQTENI